MAATISSSLFDSMSADPSRINRATREKLLKKRFAGLIQKSTKTLQKTEPPPTTTMTERMRQRRNEAQIKTRNLRRKAEIQKRREFERQKIEQMRNTSGMGDPQQVMRDFENLIGYNQDNAKTTHLSLTPYGSNTLLFQYAELTGLKGRSCCYDKYRESLSQSKKKPMPTFVKRPEHRRSRKNDDIEEGEIID